MDLNGLEKRRQCTSIVCMCVRAFVIPDEGAVQSTEVEYFEEYAIRKYINARIVAYSLEI
jgi:hypothetical protein